MLKYKDSFETSDKAEKKCNALPTPQEQIKCNQENLANFKACHEKCK